MDLIRKYFPGLDQLQERQFEKLLLIVPSLNEKVNIISRKDIHHLEERHVLHSLAIAKKFSFYSGTSIIDVGTGGGFPGIPLAIMFPDASFTLVDSILKKIRLVRELADTLELRNITTVRARIEDLDLKTDFVVSRAVTSFPQLYTWCSRLIKHGGQNQSPNGLISLKGGNLEEEIGSLKKRPELYSVSDWFEEPFFLTKRIVYLKK